MSEQPTHPGHLVGVVIVRGGGAALAQHRLPRHAKVTLGRDEKNGLHLPAAWAPRELATFSPVDEGWLVTNGQRGRMRVDSDWIDVGYVHLVGGGMAMLQRGDHRITWPQIDSPLSVSLIVRTRRMDDTKVPYVVDGRVGSKAGSEYVPGGGSYLGLEDAPMSSLLRYRLAVLYRHLIDGEPMPMHVMKRRAEFLGITEEELYESAQRYRRRVNAVQGTNLDSLEELGEYLVQKTGELTQQDLDP